MPVQALLPLLHVVDMVCLQMGDAKAQRLSADMVLAYTQARLIVISEQRVKDMFAEADYKGEGSVSRAALVASAMGRSGIAQRRLVLCRAQCKSTGHSSHAMHSVLHRKTNPVRCCSA